MDRPQISATCLTERQATTRSNGGRDADRHPSWARPAGPARAWRASLAWPPQRGPRDEPGLGTGRSLSGGEAADGLCQDRGTSRLHGPRAGHDGDEMDVVAATVRTTAVASGTM